MRRLAIALLFSSVVVCASSQTTSQTQPTPTSDAQAVSLAQQSIAALTGGASIGDVTLNANAISILGSDNETGTGVFEAKGIGESRIDLSLSGGRRSDIRNTTNGIPSGAWEKNGSSATPYAQHNCWTDAVWFFSALSSLSQTANPNFVFKYIGQEQHGGISVQHVKIFQIGSNDGGTLQTLTATDFYLNLISGLPVAAAFSSHPDDNMNVNIPAEVGFADYQLVNGVQVPFHFQEMVNGGVILNVTVTSVNFNTGLVDGLFSLQ